jgi:hypothetical protein
MNNMQQIKNVAPAPAPETGSLKSYTIIYP